MIRSLILFALFVWLPGCNNEATVYQQPPADSYQTTSVRVNVQGMVNSAQGAKVPPDFFEMAGARPLLGRFFITSDSGATPVVVLSYTFWSDRMGGSPTVIGSKIEIDSVPTVVVGIAPRDFHIPDTALLWTLK